VLSALWNYQQFTTFLYFQMVTFWMAKTFSGSVYLEQWKCIINLLKELLPAIRSIADEVLHLSEGQCTGSSCTTNSGAALSRETRIHCFWVLTCDRPTTRALNRLITAFGEKWVYQTPIQDVAELRGRGWWAHGLASSKV